MKIRDGKAVRIRVGTRGSRLARIQTARVTDRLETAGHQVEVHTFRTAGDRAQDLPFHEVGPPGVFVREIERALAAGEIDAAVHSYKDLPTTSPEGLVVAAVAERLDAADCLLAASKSVVDGAGPVPLRRGVRVGTSSARRAALLRDLRPDIVALPIRGNLPTRIAKLREGDPYDAILLAAAGLERLRDDPTSKDYARGVVRFRLDPEIFVPAPAQGALAVQVRDGDSVRAAIETLDDLARRREIEVERRLLARVEGGCLVAAGAWCRSLDDGQLELSAVLDVDGHLRRTTARDSNGERLARTVAGKLLGHRSAERT